MFIRILNKLLDLVARIPDRVRYRFYLSTCDNYDVYSMSFFHGVGIKVYGLGRFQVGSGSYCGDRCAFQVGEGCGIVIGDNVSISHNVRVYTTNRIARDIIEESTTIGISTGNVSIGDNSWIGANVFIKEGVSIGSNTVIGANSVVGKDIPANSIAVGAPIRILKKKI